MGDCLRGADRRTSQGAAAPPPPLNSGKAIIFRAKAKFFGLKPAAKNEQNIYFVFIKRKKRNSFRLATAVAEKPGAFSQ